jgi:glycosyltransferase involved in cell wall biosynthesis
MTKFSVVIPLYNKASYISRAINSVLLQTVQDFEINVVDDGSTDGGGEIVKKISDPRIRYSYQENAGVSAARNRGIKEASCDLIAFLDADDEWEKNYLETYVDLIKEYPEYCVYCQSYKTIDNKASYQYPAVSYSYPFFWKGIIKDYIGLACLGPPFNSSSICVKNTAIMEVGGFPVGITMGEDLAVWFKLSLKNHFVFCNSLSVIYHTEIGDRACLANRIEAGYFEDLLYGYIMNTDINLSDRECIYEYYTSRLLLLYPYYLLRGDYTGCKDLLRKSRNTKRFRLKRLKSLILLRMPELALFIYKKNYNL